MANSTRKQTADKPENRKRNANKKPVQQEEIILPIARDTEQKLIAICMIDPATLKAAMALGLSSDLFSVPEYRHVVDALRECYIREWAPLPSVIVDQLMTVNKMSQMAAQVLVTECMSTHMFFGRESAVLPEIFKQLRDVQMQRQTIRSAEQIQKMALENASPDEIRERLDSIRQLSPPDQKSNKTETFVSSGVHFLVDAKGVWATEEQETKQISSPLYVEAMTSDERGEGWGRLIRIIDPLGVERIWVMPATMLAGEGQSYREHLLSMGVEIKGGLKPKQHLDIYLRRPITKFARNVSHTGWIDSSFVLPDRTFGGSQDERIYLNSSAGCGHLLEEKGSLDEWKQQIAKYAINNTRLSFVLSAAFASLLLKPLGGESGGFHFYCFSSKGKSTLLLAAGSVIGGGGRKGFIRGWKASASGLEGIMETSNDLLLVLDEIAECDAREIGGIVYMIGNGRGKLRGLKMGGSRRVTEWLTMVLSAGELTIEEHMKSVNQKMMAGQEVRLVNIHAESKSGLGVFDDLHDFPGGKEFSNHLRDASIRLYGTAARALLEKITAGNLLDKIRLQFAAFKKSFISKCQKPEMTSEVHRVLERFALVGYAGHLATELGVTGWPRFEAASAAQALFEEWLGARGTAGSTIELQAVRSVRKFIETQIDRFQRIRKDEGREIEDPKIAEQVPEKWDSTLPTRNRAGFVKPDRDGNILEYHFLQEVFRDEICAGIDHKQVLSALKTGGFLIFAPATKTTPERDQNQIRIPEKKGRIRVYSIDAKILD